MACDFGQGRGWGGGTARARDRVALSSVLLRALATDLFVPTNSGGCGGPCTAHTDSLTELPPRQPSRLTASHADAGLLVRAVYVLLLKQWCLGVCVARPEGYRSRFRRWTARNADGAFPRKERASCISEPSAVWTGQVYIAQTWRFSSGIRWSGVLERRQVAAAGAYETVKVDELAGVLEQLLA